MLQCHLQAKDQSEPFSTRLDTMDDLIEEHGKSLGELLEIPLLRGDLSWIVWIDSDLDKIMKERLTIFL